MRIIERLQAFRKQHRIIGFLVDIQKTVAYPILFAALCFLSAIHGKAVYVPIFWLLCATIVFAALFTDDKKVFLVPMLMIYYGLGQDSKPVYQEQLGNVLEPFATDGLLHLCISGGVMILAVLLRFGADGTFQRAFRKKGLCFYGILAMDAAFLLNGLFASHWHPLNLLYGAFLAMGITVFYCLVLSMLDGSRDPIGYACKTLVCVSYTVLGQFLVQLIRAIQADKLWIRNISGNLMLRRDMFQMSWGIATLMGAVLVLGIPAALYLARKHRAPLLSYGSAVLFLVGSFLINARGPFLVGCLAFVLGLSLCCTGGPNKKKNRWFTLILVLLLVMALVLVHWKLYPLDALLSKLWHVLRFGDLSGGGRLALWKNGWQDFISNPLFGAGFWDGAYETVRQMDHLYSSMYHNVFVEWIGAMGLVGLFAFLWHLRTVAELLIRRFSVEKLLLLTVPIMVLAMSLLDNFFFYLNFQIFYCIFLALAEVHLEQTRAKRLAEHRPLPKDRKPRILFTYVEAGKGHVIPEQVLCDRIREQYGDQVEILESHFYTETKDSDLARTEGLFTSTVKLQNKTRILSILCWLGNFVCGDCFARYFLLRCTCSGRRSYPKALQHLEELDADVLITTHWATAFYANQMKQNRPYTVCLCPDPYSNGMFNVDVNEFQIPSLPGAKAARGRRMYAGGQIRLVDFPIRKEAEALLSQKARLRQELGLPAKAFTVTLSDGGYGMANLEKTVSHLLRMGQPMTVIALCGTNHALYERLKNLPPSPTVNLIPLPYTPDALRYLAASDLFCGKSGANSMAEPTFFQIPILITKCITYIERNTKRYYVRHLKNARYLPGAKRGAKAIARLAAKNALP